MALPDSASIDLISGYRDHFAEYHHHKELMAFTAATLYLSASTYSAASMKELLCASSAAPWIAYLVVGVAAALAVWFVCWQFGKRAVAANMVKACHCLLAQMASGVSVLDRDPSINEVEGQQYPACLVQEYKRATAQSEGLGSPSVSKWVTLTAMGFSTSLAMAAIYWFTPKP